MSQVDLKWNSIPESSLQAEPHWLPLSALKRGKRYNGQLGSLQVATWLGPKGVTARMQEGMMPHFTALSHSPMYFAATTCVGEQPHHPHLAGQI
jgi:hypothetical protein